MLLSRFQMFQFRWISTAAHLAVVVLLSGSLGACGFRPLYSQQQDVASFAEKSLAQIEIKQIKDRIGQQLRNNLLARLQPKGEPAEPRYSLSITLNESVANLGVKKSAVVTRGNLRVTATYTLLRLRLDEEAGGKNKDEEDNSLTTGTVISTSSYDIPQAQYTALAAAKDARARAVKELADDIRTRLAVYMQQNADEL